MQTIPILFLAQLFIVLVASGSPLRGKLEQAGKSERAAIQLRVADESLILVGKIVFVSPPELPEFFGLMDDNRMLHLIKADPRTVEVLTEIPKTTSPALATPMNQALNSWKDLSRIHDDKDGAQTFLRNHGYGDMIDREILTVSKYKRSIQFATWAGSAAGCLIYFTMLDSASLSSVARIGPSFLMDHFSNFIGSMFLASNAFVFGPKQRNLNRIVRLLVASSATTLNFLMENPSGLENLKSGSFLHWGVDYLYIGANVQDPGDFWAGTIAAWLVAMSPEIIKFYDQVQGRLRGYFRSKNCEHLLGKAETPADG